MEKVFAILAIIFLGFLVIGLALVIGFAAVRNWLNQQAVFEGLVGHSAVAVAALLVAGGVYGALKPEYRTEKICTNEPLGDVARDIGVAGAEPILVHVRDGIGKAKEEKPLLIRYVPLEPEGNKLCEDVTYDRKLGFQFKIFVEVRRDVSEKDLGSKVKDLLNNEKFVPQHPYNDIEDGRCSTIKEEIMHKVSYVALDKLPNGGAWRVWFLLQDYQCIAEDLTIPFEFHIWNNFVQPSD